RNAPNAAYSIVASSETRKAATLATQNTGQGEACAGRRTGFVARAVVVMASRSTLRQVSGICRRQASLDVARAVVGQHFVDTCCNTVECARDDVGGARLGS